MPESARYFSCATSDRTYLNQVPAQRVSCLKFEKILNETGSEQRCLRPAAFEVFMVCEATNEV